VLRTAEDDLSMRAYIQRHECKKAIIAGGGLLGLEAAYAIKEIGLQVTVLERGEWLMRRQLDRRAGEFLRILLGKIGLDVMTHAEVESLHGDEHLTQVQLCDGCRLETGLFLIAAGIKPNCELAKAGGLQTNNGVIVNDELQTSQKNVYAIGDAAEHNGKIYGLWTTAAEQAKIVAANVLGDHRHYQSSKPSTMLKVVGVDVYSVGEFSANEPSRQEIIDEDVKLRRYCKIVIDEHKIIGAIMIGQVAESDLIKKAISTQADISTIADQLKQLNFSALKDLLQKQKK
jgi:NAD(P)H-nitrite reductase large subunit